ncbi:MAG: hypothetical protein WCF98_05200 [Synechococcus sp. ELA057]
MSRFTPCSLPAGVGLAALLLCTCAQTPARSQQKLDPQVFPPTTVFRNLQLTTLACSRENTASSCDQSRSQADPLLDHPLLSAGCKDVLWEITQNARTVQTPSLERRDALDKVANQLTIICRPGAPLPAPKGKGAP